MNKPLIFIVFAAVVLGGAFSWNTFMNKDQEVETIIKEEAVSTESEPKTKPKITIASYDQPKSEPIVPAYSEEEMVKRRKVSKSFMQFAVRYHNKEDVIRDLEAFKQLGKTEKLEHLIIYAERTYPEIDLSPFE